MIRRLSVRWRITLVAAGLFAVALGLASFVLVRAVRSNLVDSIRSSDEQQLAALAAQLEEGIPDQVHLPQPPPRPAKALADDREKTTAAPPQYRPWREVAGLVSVLGAQPSVP